MKNALFAAITISMSSCLYGAINPSASDLFNVSNGTTITASSGFNVLAGTSTGMFGGSAAVTEGDRTLFADYQSSGFVHYVEFKTATAVLLNQVRLFAAGDGATYNYQREFSRFLLKAKSPGSVTYDITIIDHTPTHPYSFVDSSTLLSLDEVLLSPVTAKEFRAEFINYVSGNGYDGPRILELDGFGCIAPDWDDVFDVSQNNTVTGISGLYPGSTSTDMFGDDSASVDTTATLFEDDQPPGTTHYVEFSTAYPVSLSRVLLFAAGDGPLFCYQREFATFRLKAKGSGSSVYNLTLGTFSPAGHPYSFLCDDTMLVYDLAISPSVTAQHFRAEFDQYTSACDFNGPRIIELDGIGQFVP